MTNGNVISLCIEGGSDDYSSQYIYDDEQILKYEYDNEIVSTPFQNRVYKWKFVPASVDIQSVNWYVNNGTFFNFLKKVEDRIPRDYSKEYAICNLQYNPKFNEIKFTVLPKPVVHIPTSEEPLWRFKTILFNSNGEPDPKGKYTSNDYVIDPKTGSYTLNNINSMYECYPKLTVYEFNYDFLMGMQLFDPTVVAARLMETVINLRYSNNGRIGLGVKVNKSETAYQMRIAEIIKNIIESTAYEVSDCFYSFDNSKYDSMLRDAELKRSQMHIDNDGVNNARQGDGTDAYDILNEFDNNATLNENKEVIKRAITQATANITEEVLPEDKYSIQFNIIQELINSLVIILVETLISPKIILLFEVNRALMGQYDFKKYKDYDIEFFIKSIEGLLVSIIKELRDIILQSLLDWCLKILTELHIKAAELMIKEQLEYYSRLMKLLFKACSFKASHRAALDSELDHVDYADIDEIDRPKESNC